MTQLNCWEFKRCGRQPEGDNTEEMGLCPATTDSRLDGVHNGVNAGRACWVIAGTFCDGEIQGTFVEKKTNCVKCNFYQLVSKEEFGNFKMSHSLNKLLKMK